MRHRKREADEDAAGDPGECKVRGAPAAPAELVAGDEVAGVERPRDDRHDHDRVEAGRLGAQPRKADSQADGEERERDEDRPRDEAFQGDEGRSRAREDRRVVALQAALLPEVERRQERRDREPGERREHEPDVQDEEDARVVALPRAQPPGRACDAEQDRGQGRAAQPEEPEARRTAPAEVDPDDEPDEEVERAAPGLPREAARPRGLRGQQRRGNKPADANPPDPEPRAHTGAARLAEERDRSLAVGEKRGPEQKLGHGFPRRSSSRVWRSSRTSLSAMITTYTSSTTRTIA